MLVIFALLGVLQALRPFLQFQSRMGLGNNKY